MKPRPPNPKRNNYYYSDPGDRPDAGPHDMLPQAIGAKEVAIVSSHPRTVRVCVRDPVQGTERTGDALFQQNTVLVSYADGSQALYPYAESQLTVGGDDGVTPILTLVSGYQEYVTLYVLERRIGDRLDPAMPAELRRRLTKLSASGWLRRLGFLPTLTAVAGLGLGVWYGAIWTFSTLVDHVPTTVDIALGERMATAYASNVSHRDPVVSAALQAIGQHLTAQLPAGQPWRFTFRVWPNRTENAFALPGGPILVTSALVAASASPDEIAGILGHEIEHVVGRHTFHRIASNLGMGLALSVGDHSVFGTMAYQAKDLLALRYDRAQELAADETGMVLANRAGYRADALGAFFRRLQRADGQTAGQAAIASYLSTHPAHGDRLAHLAALTATLPPRGPRPGPLAVDWATVRRHAATLTAAAGT